MRNKKTNLMYYIIAAVAVLVIAATVFMEVPLSQEHVEQSIK